MKKLLLFGLRAYQAAIRPFLPPSCRFYPSCSNYSMEALRKHGALKGVWLTVIRLLKCHPFHPGGIDEVA